MGFDCFRDRQKGWWAISIDLRGHGRSSWVPDQHYGLDGFAADIDFILEEEEIVPVLVGASLGEGFGYVLSGEIYAVKFGLWFLSTSFHA